MTSRVGKYHRIRLLDDGIVEDHLAQTSGLWGFNKKTLVLQCLRSDMAEAMELPRMFLDTAREAAGLRHPRVARVFDFGEADGTYFLAREHVDGPSLRQVIGRAAARGMPLPATLCARIISQACEGLAYIHDFIDPQTQQPAELLHACVRPHNILLSRQGMTQVVDFGIDSFRARFTPKGMIPILGPHMYMSPEEVRGLPGDRRIDVYSLGVVLYELLTLRKPFAPASDWDLPMTVLSKPMVPAEQHRPDLPVALRDVLTRALAKERDQRYPDCRELQADLEEFIRSEGAPVTPRQVAQLIQHVTSDDPNVVAPDGLETQSRSRSGQG
ncbi:serine/threonine protein kinase [Myxococcus sp. K38C18041901]|uniref:serine/threonine protein kinase n=1 Tax=Myxococcus guangdongensis TaxID=2906760 RepID=UPI0020A7B0DB|nr:protein kinase [Myxococcus guangdongensis]MCP3058622.1 serine/threonine protein kinase [Myxococcus guangdongensis]